LCYHKPAIGIVRHGLRVDVAGAHVLDVERQPLAVLERLVRAQRPQVGLLHLGVLGPDDLAAAVHGHGRLLAAQLDQDGALVVADGDVVGAAQAAQRPHALQAVVERVVQAVCVGVPQLDGTFD